MLKVRPKSIITVLAVFALCSCIDPYTPDLSGYGSLLVVDGLITDENTSTTVKLSRTFQEQNSIPLGVSDATVFISDDTGEKTYLNNVGGGIYKTDSTAFRGTIGRTYVLHVISSAGVEYKSIPCLMESVSEIDNIYFEKDHKYINNGTETSEGITIYLDSKEDVNNKCYRWVYEESWKFRVPNPKGYNYINENLIVSNSNPKIFCWKSSKSKDIITHQANSKDSSMVVKEPILFISSNKSDRLLVRYSILVKQYSISKSEYDFWENLKRINEIGGDIFAAQPYAVISNMQNINNPGEVVMGYFQVSSVKQKRMYISLDDIVGFNLPYYHYPCFRKEDSPYIKPWVDTRMTWDDLYYMYTTSGYDFIEAKYTDDDPSKGLYRMIFTKHECADCEVTGTLKKPDFWTDTY
jgi:Domain of unknown function (DUF4249)